MLHLADLLMIAVVSEAYERELVAHKGLWYGEGLLFPPILLNVIKVTSVSVTAQFRHYWGCRCTQDKKKKKGGRLREMQPTGSKQ